jgi:hypothetical protein
MGKYDEEKGHKACWQHWCYARHEPNPYVQRVSRPASTLVIKKR